MGIRAGLVVNPAAGRVGAGADATTLTGMLRERGHDVVALSGPSPGAALHRARSAVAAGSIDVLVAAGGDGMVHLALNATARSGVPVAVVAQGSGNDVAADLGLPVADPVAALDLLDHGRPRVLDAGRVEDRGQGGAERTWFAGTLYGGFDSLVGARANRWRWPHGGLRYQLALARELPVFRPIPYEVEVDGTRIVTEAMLVVVANTSSYGGGMRICPQAVVDDGLLDVLVLHDINRVELLRVLPRVYSGTHLDHPAVEVLRGRRVSLRARGVFAHADGEPFAPLPLTCHASPGAWTVLSPAAG